MKPFTGAICTSCGAPSAHSIETIARKGGKPHPGWGKPNPTLLPECCPNSSWTKLPPKTPLTVTDDFHISRVPEYDQIKAAGKQFYNANIDFHFVHKCFDEKLVLVDSQNRLFPIIPKDIMKVYNGNKKLNFEGMSLYADRKGGSVYWVPIP